VGVIIVLREGGLTLTCNARLVAVAMLGYSETIVRNYLAEKLAFCLWVRPGDRGGEGPFSGGFGAVGEREDTGGAAGRGGGSRAARVFVGL